MDFLMKFISKQQIDTKFFNTHILEVGVRNKHINLSIKLLLV